MMITPISHMNLPPPPQAALQQFYSALCVLSKRISLSWSLENGDSHLFLLTPLVLKCRDDECADRTHRETFETGFVVHSCERLFKRGCDDRFKSAPQLKQNVSLKGAGCFLTEELDIMVKGMQEWNLRGIRKKLLRTNESMASLFRREQRFWEILWRLPSRILIIL